MITFKDAIEILGNLANMPRIDDLRSFINFLEYEKIDLKSQVEQLKLQLLKVNDWSRTKKHYKRHKTKKNYIVYTCTKDTLPNLYYCPVCMEKEKVPIPLQPGGKGIYCPVCKTSYMN